MCFYDSSTGAHTILWAGLSGPLCRMTHVTCCVTWFIFSDHPVCFRAVAAQACDSDGMLLSPLHRVRGSKQMNTVQCARHVYQTEGIRGFYRGLTASYAGISETVICFAIYESLKKHLKAAPLAPPTNGTEKNSTNFFGLMAAAAVSKGCASCIAYPHGTCCLFSLSLKTAVRFASSVSISRAL